MTTLATALVLIVGVAGASLVLITAVRGLGAAIRDAPQSRRPLMRAVAAGTTVVMVVGSAAVIMWGPIVLLLGGGAAAIGFLGVLPMAARSDIRRARRPGGSRSRPPRSEDEEATRLDH